MNRPTLIDLFAGCGGLTQGFVAAGFRPVLAVEFDVSAAATYAANFGDVVHVGDIAKLDLDSVPKVDVVVGGPPCQGFSGLGLRNLDDPRNKLWRHYLEVVRRAEPEVFVIENVARFRHSADYLLLLEALKSGVLQEYEIWSGELSAEDFGVPQRRRRAFVIGARGRSPKGPRPTHQRLGSPELGITRWTSVKEAFDAHNIPIAPSGLDLPPRTIEFEGRRIPGPFEGLEIHLGRKYQAKSIQRYRHVPPGGNRFDLPEDLLFDCWRKKRSGTTDVMGRLSWDQPSVTIRTEFFKPEKGRYLHPLWHEANPSLSQDRALTLFEGAILQSFPEDFRWCGSKVQIAKQIGNAVPPDLAEQIATQSVLPLLGEPARIGAGPSAHQLELIDVVVRDGPHANSVAVPRATSAG